MITVNIRKQGGAAVITIPSDVLKILNVDVGTILELDVTNRGFTARPLLQASLKRYSLAELLRGVMPQEEQQRHEETQWAQKVAAEGRELP